MIFVVVVVVVLDNASVIQMSQFSSFFFYWYFNLYKNRVISEICDEKITFIEFLVCGVSAVTHIF